MDDFRYSYAVARTNALGTSLIDKDTASRMLAAEPQEVLGILAGTALAESFVDVSGPSEIEKGLMRELGKAYDLLERICPEKEAIRLFRYRYDFHNLKAMLKSRVTGVPYSDSLVELGTYDVERLAAAVSEDNYRFIAAHLADTAADAMAEYSTSNWLDCISAVCDRAMWLFIAAQARRNSNKVVREVFRERINLANLKTFFRIRESGADPHFFERYFIEGGSYEIDLFLDHMNEELGLFLDHLATTQDELHIVSEGLKAWPEDRSFRRLEIASENHLLRRFHLMRHQVFGIAPLIYYLLRKISETRLIRTIVGCKLIGMPRSRIEERLAYIYV